MQFVAYLNFDGRCREAFEFYHRVFGGDLTAMITHADMGIPAEDGNEGMILHARLVIADQTLMGSDALSEAQPAPNPVQVSVQLDSVSEAERIFTELSAEGNIMIPLEEQQWAVRFGFLADRFGIPWMISVEAEGAA